jgi:microcystin-dependent protein
MFGPTPGSKSKAGQSFPRGTTVLFVQSAAPFGWTRVSTFDDSLLRIVGSAAPGSGGSNGFVATFNSQTATGAFTLTTATIPSHSHTVQGSENPTYTGGSTFPAYIDQNSARSNATTSVGSGGSHSHGITTSIKYVDALIASKN